MTHATPSTTPPAATDSPAAAITIRTDVHTRTLFKDACEASGTTMQRATEMFIEATIAHHTTRSIRHLDGSICPIAAMIDALAASVRFEVTNRPTPPRTY